MSIFKRHDEQRPSEPLSPEAGAQAGVATATRVTPAPGVVPPAAAPMYSTRLPEPPPRAVEGVVSETVTVAAEARRRARDQVQGSVAVAVRRTRSAEALTTTRGRAGQLTMQPREAPSRPPLPIDPSQFAQTGLLNLAWSWQRAGAPIRANHGGRPGRDLRQAREGGTVPYRARDLRPARGAAGVSAPHPTASPGRSTEWSDSLDRPEGLDLAGRLTGDLDALDDFARELGVHSDADLQRARALGLLPRRINADQATAERDLAKLVLTLIELVRQLMERVAVRRVNAGSLSEEEVERMGETFLRLERRMEELTAAFGLRREDLKLNLGPLGDLL
jgi:hypothetical protein